MNYFSSSSLGPLTTPKAIKYLIIATCLIAILSACTQEIFDIFKLFPGPQYLLSFSWWGLRQWFLWQPFTFLFVQSSVDGGLSFYFLLKLLFEMYLLWVIGTALFEMIGQRSFLRLYFFGTIAAASISLLSMQVTSEYEMITGIAPALIIITTVWIMGFADTEILLFFLIPFKAKWIAVGIVSAMMLTALTHWEISLLILYIAAVAIGYGYSSFVWGWRAPFPVMNRFDDWLMKIGFAGRKKPTIFTSDKVIDITSGQPPQNDEAFVDAMLAKISRHGENSLSWSERRRLQKISEQKMRNRRQ